MSIILQSSTKTLQFKRQKQQAQTKQAILSILPAYNLRVTFQKKNTSLTGATRQKK